MVSVVAALVLLAASTAHHVDSGVSGLVTIGPTCPVERPGDPSCRDRPYRASLEVVRRKSHVFVKGFASKGDGRFRVHLAPGRYLIEQERPGRLPSLAPLAVRVRAHRFTRVAIQFDSGIR
jgi:hypothetical protein